MINTNAKTDSRAKSVNLGIPETLIERIRALQPIYGKRLGVRKASQVMVVAKGVSLLEKVVENHS